MLPSSSRAVRQNVSRKSEVGGKKSKAKMLVAVMCVERNALLLSLTELCKNGRWKPLPGTVLGLSLLMHRLNTHSTACWYPHIHTHAELSRSCPEDPLITLSKREAVRHKEGQPPGLSHTHHQDSPSFL